MRNVDITSPNSCALENYATDLLYDEYVHLSRRASAATSAAAIAACGNRNSLQNENGYAASSSSSARQNSSSSGSHHANGGSKIYFPGNSAQPDIYRCSVADQDCSTCREERRRGVKNGKPYLGSDPLYMNFTCAIYQHPRRHDPRPNTAPISKENTADSTSSCASTAKFLQEKKNSESQAYKSAQMARKGVYGRIHSVKCTYSVHAKNLLPRLRDLRFEKNGNARVNPPCCDLVLPPPVFDVHQFWKRMKRLQVSAGKSQNVVAPTVGLAQRGYVRSYSAAIGTGSGNGAGRAAGSFCQR